MMDMIYCIMIPDLVISAYDPDKIIKLDRTSVSIRFRSFSISREFSCWLSIFSSSIIERKDMIEWVET